MSDTHTDIQGTWKQTFHSTQTRRTEMKVKPRTVGKIGTFNPFLAQDVGGTGTTPWVKIPMPECYQVALPKEMKYTDTDMFVSMSWPTRVVWSTMDKKELCENFLGWITNTDLRMTVDA